MRNTWFLGVCHEKSCIKFNVLASAGLGGGYADVPWLAQYAEPSL